MKVQKMVTGPLQENCFIVYNEKTKQAILVDPGDDAAEILESLREKDLTVKAILLTHTHYDHIGAVDTLREALEIPAYAPVGEKEMLSDGMANLSLVFAGRLITATADQWVDDNEVLDFGDGLRFETILVPGHSPYSICYYMREAGCVLAGDTLFRQSVGRVDFYLGDKGDLVKNIRARLLVLPDETVVYSGHGFNTKIGTEKSTNPFLSEEGFWSY